MFKSKFDIDSGSVSSSVIILHKIEDEKPEECLEAEVAANMNACDSKTFLAQYRLRNIVWNLIGSSTHYGVACWRLPYYSK